MSAQPKTIVQAAAMAVTGAPDTPNAALSRIGLSAFAKDGKTPARKRFATAANLVVFYRKLITDSLAEDSRRARIRRVYDQFPPYDGEKLKARGLANATNMRFGTLAGIIDARAGAVMEWALDTTDLVELHALSADQAGPDAQLIADTIAQEFSYTLRDTPSFLPAISGCIRDRDLYGLGPLGWPDAWDYAPVSLERGQVKFPDTSPTISSKC